MRPYIHLILLPVLLLTLAGCVTTSTPYDEAQRTGAVGEPTVRLMNDLVNQQIRQNLISQAATQNLQNTLGATADQGAAQVLAEARTTAVRAAQGELTARSAAEATRSSTRITEEQTDQISRQLKAILDSQAEINIRLQKVEASKPPQ